MILQEQGEELMVIRQTDHAMLCGFLAREWGNELFAKPEPFASFCLAAAEHDNGWIENELRAEIDPRTHLPYSFMSIPTEEHMAVYRRGMDRLTQKDPYAGLLVSMHCSGLYDRAKATMPGFSAKYIKANETQLVSTFVHGLRLQQLRLKVDLRIEPELKAFTEEKALQANVKRLEVLDRLSLYFCINPPQNTVIDGVPVDSAGRETDVELRPEERAVVIHPYPFGRDPLDFSVLARRVPKKVYTDDGDFQRTLTRAPYFGMAFRVRRDQAAAA